MFQYLVRAQAAGRVNMTELTQYAAQEAERSKPFLDAPRYFSSILASYVCGMQFLAGGTYGRSSRHPTTGPSARISSRPGRTSPLDRAGPSPVEVLGSARSVTSRALIEDAAVERWLAQPGRWIVRKDTIGELLIAILTTARDKPPSLAALQAADAWTSPAARGWGGDRFFLLASGPTAADAARALKDLKGVWITAWDTRADRDEFAGLARNLVHAWGDGDGFAGLDVGAEVAFVGFEAPSSAGAALVERLGNRSLVAGRAGRQ